MRVIAALVMSLLATAGIAAAADSPWASLADPAFMRIDTRELPESVVCAIAQDRAGFLWVGTQGGLGRYDGYHFKNYLPNPSDPSALPDGYVRSLLAANDGLWIGTDSAGLVHFDSASETFHTWRSETRGKHGPRSATVFALANAADGGLWVGGDAGLDAFNPATGTFAPVRFVARATPSRAVHAILVDRSGTVWIGSDDGLYRRANGAARFQRIPLRTALQPPLQIRRIYEDRAGRIWVGTVDALYRLNRNGSIANVFRWSATDPNTLAPGAQVSIIETTPGTMWVGSSDAGFSVIDAATGRVRRVMADPDDAVGLTAGRAWQFLRDRSGLIWIANYGGGLLLYNPLTRGAYVLSRGREAMAETGAITLALHQGRLWIGGTRGVLVALQPNAPPVYRNVPNGTTIVGLATGSRGELWIGLLDKLCMLYSNAAAVDCTNQPNGVPGRSVVWTVLETPDAYWVGTSLGLYVEDKRTGAVTIYHQGNGPNNLSSDLAGVLYRDRARFIWVGTANGIDRIDPTTRRVTPFTFDPRSKNSFGPGSIESILQDRSGRLWVAMNGGPLNLISDPDGQPRFRRIDRSDGLPHQNVDGLAQDARGTIWASTDAGIASIDPATLRIRSYGPADGVLGGNYWGGSVAQAPDGTIFFGGDDGVTVIAPGMSSRWTYAPPIVLTSLKIADRFVPLGTNVRLQPGARDVTAEFAALDYSEPRQLQYQYQLQGYDRDWIATDTLHRIATWTNLPPGRYLLRVRATNRLGVWGTRELSVPIDALPAWYETWWFRVLLVLAIVLAALGLGQLRTIALRRRAEELETLVRERTKALEEASMRDPLTGLRNRRFLMQNIGRDVNLTLRRYDQWHKDGGARPDDADLLVFMIDIDHFKRVNDTYGHHAGDLVLVQMRECLQRVFRESDYLVRWGGEEFLVVTRGSPRSDAAEIAERVRTEVERHPFALGDGRSLDKTVSIGFAAFPFDPSKPHEVTLEQTIELADRALYSAKESGRNAWRDAAATLV